jgi:DNA-binding NtrC family response regulator
MSRILIIDDDAGVRAYLQYGLSLGAHDVVVANNGDEGIQRHRESPVDLVITDLFMPEKDGLETIVAIRRETPSIPIIAISGGHVTSGSVLQAARLVGAANVLEKPFDAGKLLSMIDEALQPKRHSV